MTTYVAFLRGINVGGRVVKMADLRDCLDKAGYGQVTTIAQTGNVIFENDDSANKLKSDLEKQISKTFNYQAKVQVVSVADLQKIVTANPFSKPDSTQHDYVIFFENGLEKLILKEEYTLAAGEKVKAGRGVIYWRVDKGQTLRSSFGKALSKAKYKQFNTNRNLNTLQKIIDAS